MNCKLEYCIIGITVEHIHLVICFRFWIISGIMYSLVHACMVCDICTCVNIYIYIEREREGDREREKTAE